MQGYDRPVIERLWADGYGGAEIGRRLGWEGRADRVIQLLRRHGFELPKRVHAACVYCGAQLPPRAEKGGKPRKWCSRRCKDIDKYTDECPSCDGRKRITAKHCMGCKGPSEAQAAAARESRELVERMWLAGSSKDEIADALGTTRKAVGSRLRRYRNAGAVLPHGVKSSYRGASRAGV